MKSVIVALLVSFIVLILIFVCIGGNFDRQFWLAFLPGLMENLLILAVGVLILDMILKHERLDKLERTNERQSRFVLLINNRLAFKILQYLRLATTEEVDKDPEYDFSFALGRLKTIDLEKVFYEKLMNSDKREDFVAEFEKMLRKETAGISKALDDVYPRPDPELKLSEDAMVSSIAAVGALLMIIRSFREANAQVEEKGQLKPEQQDLLIEIAYDRIGQEIQRIRDITVNLSEKAAANRLFLSFE